MIIKTIDTATAIDFLKNDPILCSRALPDDLLQHLVLPAELNKEGIYYNNELIAILFWSIFTEVTISVHLFIASKYHGTGMAEKINKKLIKYWSNSNLHKVVRFVPKACSYVSAALEKCGFELEGTLKDSVIWRRQITDLQIYSIHFNRKIN